MGAVKLIVCDIDDTLVHKELHLRESTRELIHSLKDRGVDFTIATGRMPHRAEVFAREAELQIPYIANNGSILYDRGKIVYAKLLDAAPLQKPIQACMKKDPEITVLFSYLDGEKPLVRTKWINDRLHKYLGYDQTLGDTDETWNQKVHKVYVVDDGRTGVMNDLAEELRKQNPDCSFFQYGDYSMEIVAKGCSKASGVEHLMEYLGVTPEQTMAIGDHTNDIEVIRMVGTGVAVANAVDQLKAVADYVTKRERADGVEEAINRFVLGDT